MSKYLLVDGIPFILNSKGLISQAEVPYASSYSWSELQLCVLSQGSYPVLHHEITETVYQDILKVWMGYSRLKMINGELMNKIDDLKGENRKLIDEGNDE